MIDINKIFEVLSNSNRACILTNLHYKKIVNVTNLQLCSNSSQSNISQQLSKLRDLNIIDYEKRGNEVYYKIIDKNMINFLNILEKENLLPQGGGK